MNYWIAESIKLANSLGYLDRLAEVYPVKFSAKLSTPHPGFSPGIGNIAAESF